MSQNTDPCKHTQVTVYDYWCGQTWEFFQEMKFCPCKLVHVLTVALDVPSFMFMLCLLFYAPFNFAFTSSN
jgi:hypothetical protein